MATGRYRLRLPLSRHLPVPLVDGRRTENLNEIRVRLWTGCSFHQHGEVGGGDALDPLAHLLDRRLEPISGAAPS
jgi:hypothetical protein